MEIVHIDTIINLGIPHVGENIFASLEADDLIQCRKVLDTWKVLAAKILLVQWKGKLLEACQEGKTEITGSPKTYRPLQTTTVPTNPTVPTLKPTDLTKTSLRTTTVPTVPTLKPTDLTKLHDTLTKCSKSL